MFKCGTCHRGFKNRAALQGHQACAKSCRFASNLKRKESKLRLAGDSEAAAAAKKIRIASVAQQSLNGLQSEVLAGIYSKICATELH